MAVAVATVVVAAGEDAREKGVLVKATTLISDILRR